MKITLLLISILLAASCGGGATKNEVSESELYGEKRADCTSTKRTDEGANVLQCANIRPDAKQIENTSNSVNENYDPEDYKPSKYQNISE